MIKFEVKNRWTGSVQFVAEIDCGEGEKHSVKLGLAIKWAVKTGADLTGANLARADLARAYLAGANLADANLAGANLARADLARANLAGANLARANLARAYLAGADLAGANLARADLARAYLAGARGNMAELRSIQIEDWPITYTSDVMQIGCQNHPLDAWRNFSDAEIRVMDGVKALNFWKKWKALIFQIIEMAPAKPTNPVAPAEAEAGQ